MDISLGDPDGTASSPTTQINTIARITLRDYFAGKAMQAILGNPEYRYTNDDAVAREAYNAADAMLKARSLP